MTATITRLLRLGAHAPRGVLVLVLLGLGVTATYVGQGIVIARVIAQVLHQPDAGRLVALLLAAGGLQVVRAGLLVARETLALTVSSRVKEAVRERIAQTLFDLGPNPLQRLRTGGLQSTSVDSVELLDPLVGRFVPQLAVTTLGGLAVTAYVASLDPLVGIIVLLCAIGAPVSSVVGSRLIKARGDAWDRAYRDLYAENLDAVQGMATLKAFNASRRVGLRLEQRAVAFCRDSIRVMVAWCASAAVSELVVPLGSAAAIGIGVWHATTGSLGVTDLFVILLLTRECFRPLQDLQAAHHASYQALPASVQIFALLDARQHTGSVPATGGTSDATTADATTADTTASAATAHATAQSPGGATRPAPDGPPGLRFESVRFTYESREQPALTDLTLTIRPGERIAVVGRSGAGKSTIVSLLLRFVEPDSGTITLGGRDIRAMPPSELRSLVGLVSQDTYLFHGTVEENLRLGRPDADEPTLVAAARAARAHDFIEALPQGYRTLVGERGLTLSGGERQRIAIARALLKDAPVLVLDEPTSSIDASNEAEIQSALDRLTRGRTTLLIAHRLSTVRDADRIVVLDEGRVVEAGDHETLLGKAGGAYAQLVTAQAGAGS